MWDSYSPAALTLPLGRVETPADAARLAEVVRAAAESRTPIYPLGGETSLSCGALGTPPGVGLSLRNLNKVVDYPYNDSTITVEAGVTLGELQRLVGAHRQRLPIDAPQPEQATVGGLVATNSNGARRYRFGTVRDYVIGVSAVDGRGVPFTGGGRVVKNVAGYDFCKLLTGSMGTLAVVTQVTLKLVPAPETTAFAAIDLPDAATAEKYLAALVHTKTTPTAIELLTGPEWANDPALGAVDAARPFRLVVGYEGTPAQIDWLLNRITEEWKLLAAPTPRLITGDAAEPLWDRLREFPAGDAQTVVLRVGLLPSGVVPFCEAVLSSDPQASIQAHAGDGAVFVRCSPRSLPSIASDVQKLWRPLCQKHQGHLVVWQQPQDAGWGRDVAIGDRPGEQRLMEMVKKQFDPHGILNPGRFVFG
ncbi:MAG TPA: FAD-binding oxidoreductase [Pirellulales bacterium]